ncbi:TadE/TadG family type IV pilus assembly protein [Hansschlegelia zhihuaiae]|uniref:Pilus assembly protein n=1 Tax=Hansschlegelia zhihuaiae TaxID=405005 RepID=A0A4Q0MMT8_9HYPH|nr:TadE/TadG family type IV pilus assembly protein [Hansschlegelia zhihuaiae]RXF75131.1 pilus assembly protein [Hansschlegelia zhihuaiae]
MARPALISRLRRFRGSQDGLAAIEFALMAPVLATLLLGGYDLTRFIQVRSGVDKVGFSVADVTAQYKALNSSTMAQVFRITGSSLKSYRSGVNGVTILTSVYLDNTTPRVRWQCYSTNGSQWQSKIGKEGAAANVDKALLADGNDNLIVSEVFYRYEPLFTQFVTGNIDLHTQSLYRPRLGALNTKPC